MRKSYLVLSLILMACDGGEFSNRTSDEPLPGTGGEAAVESLASGATLAPSTTGGASSAGTSQPRLPPVTGGQAATGGQSSTGGTSGLVTTGGASTNQVSTGGAISTGGQAATGGLAATGGFAASNTGSCETDASCKANWYCNKTSGQCQPCTAGYPKCACITSTMCFAPYQCSAGICVTPE